jgi:hypothetical protein
LSLDSVFELEVDCKIHDIAGKALQQWILKEREELKGPRGILFSRILLWMTFGGERSTRDELAVVITVVTCVRCASAFHCIIKLDSVCAPQPIGRLIHQRLS